MPTISVSQEVYEELKKMSQSWEDTPTRIIARLLKTDGSKRSKDMEDSSNIWIPPEKKSKKPLKDRTSPDYLVEKIIMVVLAEEGPEMIDPQLVTSETIKIMELNDLLGKGDMLPFLGRTGLERVISKLHKEFISEGLASSAEGMWLLTEEGLKKSEEIKKGSRLFTGKENGSNQLTTPKVTYNHSRLCFLKEKIERLGSEETFRIICTDGIFQMTVCEFYEVFENIVNSNSYQDRGIYHSPRPPQKAMQFKIL
jgi:hypothetical protein